MKIKSIFRNSILTVGLLSAVGAHAEAESWYFHGALGYGIPIYPKVIADEIKKIKDLGATNIPISLDLGFYWPVADGTLILGPSINGLTDSYVEDSDQASVIKTGIYFSAIKTFSQEPGSGFFVRGDLGFPRIVVMENNVEIAGSGYGIGALGGAGYGISFGGTRLLFEASYAWSRVESLNYGTTSINIGGLF